MITSSTKTLPNISLSADLPSRISEFIASARHQGFVIGVNETLDAQQLALNLGITNKRELQHGLKSLMCNNNEDWQRFDQLFHFYWQSDNVKQGTFDTRGGKGPRNENTDITEEGNANNQNNSRSDADFDVPEPTSLDSAGAGEGSLSESGASMAHSTQTQSFDHLQDPIELRRLENLAEELAQRIRKRLSRRSRHYRRGRDIYMRRTIHNSLRHHGLPIKLNYKRRQRKSPKLVLLLDVSKSMQVYSYLFLRFARGILGAFKQADAFAFHTHLIHIGDTLRDPSPGRLAEKMSLISAGWGGGTRIGDSLLSFNQNYSKVVNGQSIVIIVSDGYDTGDVDVLVKQLRRLKPRARRLVWLNPLLGREDYSPETKCMKAALPLIDVFASAHNLQSLAELEAHLS